ncbi:hypothetical protein EJ04DRAFT_96187 [Polyplosphaeria fusca]|uniref:Uncharacterized protein n=1 Tax=Polyplosphaeria fusca TaxID=682080 RepID=A0A9P4QPI3_9PLEO|nr:hypothetical protein EJ04DRAFT_96187 [Polyplosphaeria fusca]
MGPWTLLSDSMPSSTVLLSSFTAAPSDLANSSISFATTPTALNSSFVSLVSSSPISSDSSILTTITPLSSSPIVTSAPSSLDLSNSSTTNTAVLNPSSTSSVSSSPVLSSTYTMSTAISNSSSVISVSSFSGFSDSSSSSTVPTSIPYCSIPIFTFDIDSTTTLTVSHTPLDTNSTFASSTASESIMFTSPSAPYPTAVVFTNSSFASTSSMILETSTTPEPSPVSSTPTFPVPSNTSDTTMPTNFCLKIVTPNHPLNGYVMTSAGPNTNLVIQAPGIFTYPVAYFNLESSGRWVTSEGDIMTVYTPLSSTRFARPITPDTISSAPASYPTYTCSIEGDNSFQCLASNGKFTWDNFAMVGSNNILMVTTETEDVGNIAIVKLGVFPRTQCPGGSA